MQHYADLGLTDAPDDEIPIHQGDEEEDHDYMARWSTAMERAQQLMDRAQQQYPDLDEASDSSDDERTIYDEKNPIYYAGSEKEDRDYNHEANFGLIEVVNDDGTVSHQPLALDVSDEEERTQLIAEAEQRRDAARRARTETVTDDFIAVTTRREAWQRRCVQERRADMEQQLRRKRSQSPEPNDLRNKGR
jgi:hypothetical protein